MKTTVLILFFFIWTNCFGQFDRYKGIWITPSQEAIQIGDTGSLKNNNYLSNANLNDEDFDLFIYEDTLSFQKHYYSSATEYKKLYVDRYDLKIIKLTDTMIELCPVSKFSKIFFQNKSKLTFIKQQFAIDTSIKFEKIVFHTTDCFGTCPIYHLEVDSFKKVKLNAELVYKSRNNYQRDTASQGYFIGQLSNTTFKELIKAIQTCNLQTLKVNKALCCDVSIKTIIVYYNGQRKYLRTMFQPMITLKLIGTLFKICEENGFEKTLAKFKPEE